ncbi:MAG TPA: hypothetical protein VGP87_10795 [Gemmatimonadales bacterium]|nr:hypothetical protein [Gemmatimonadales bacterium]
MPFLIVLVAAAAAVFSYRLLEGWGARSWIPAVCRAAGWGVVALLLVNASCPTIRPSVRPTVLLDASLSMQAAGGRWTEALAQARATGDVRLVGPMRGDTTPSAGTSRLAPAIAAAGSGERPVVVFTDGEVEDADALPPDLLAGTTIKVLPRQSISDVALVRVSGGGRLTPTDSLRIEVEAQAFGPAREWKLGLVAREGARVWLRGALKLDAGGRGRAELAGPLPAVPPGPHVLSIELTGASDPEPRDDARNLVLTIVPTPGIVLLASPPTWESRFLFETLRDVAALPVRGYVETEHGRWRRAGDLKPVTLAEVSDAARRADVLVTLGESSGTPATRARGRWLWPGAGSRPGSSGDWYLSVGPASPVSGGFAGVAVDSFPPGTAVADLTAGATDWTGLTAQASRRGTVRPVMLGHDSAGIRRVIMGVDGLWRWAFRGGSSEQGYRGLVSSSLAWLLGGADSSAGRARLLHEVVQRGRPVIFEWNGSGPPAATPVSLSADSAARSDTLVFDGAGRAELILPPGTWHYRLTGGGQGTFAVETYSDEWLPTPRTLAARDGADRSVAGRNPVRSWLWLFGLGVVAFAGEWLARRRLGLR